MKPTGNRGRRSGARATAAALRRRLALRFGVLAVRATLLVSPRPAVLMLRRLFAAGGANTARALWAHAPDGIVVRRDERYGADEDSVLDIYRPEGREPLPVVFWVHGGGWLGGSKEELEGFFRLIAARGYTVVAPRYSLAPEHPYPTALRQIMGALAHLMHHPVELGIDPGRIVLGGDSAGAQLAAQTAALVTTPGYADAVGVPAAVTPESLQGVVLACGAYDLSLLRDGWAVGRVLATAILWAYSGHRAFDRDANFALASVANHVSSNFPPALLTVGNADPLREHSIVLAARLRELGVEIDTVFFPDDHDPPLGHEYQFDLDTEEGRMFQQQLDTFLARRLAA